MALNLTPTSAVYNASGKFGQSMSGGRARFTSGGSILPLDMNFTVDGWVKNAGVAGIQIFASQLNAFWIGAAGDGSLVLKYGSAPNEVSVNTTTAAALLTGGAWHHVQFSIDAALGAKLWFDGALVATSAVTPSAAGLNPVGIFEIGSLNNGANAWVGETDGFAVWRGAKTSVAVPTAAYTGAEAGLITLYALDGNTNDTATQAAASAVTVLPPSVAYIGTAATFNVAVNGGLSGSVTITPSTPDGGTFTPSSVTLNATTPSASFTYTGAALGNKTISFANSGGLTNPAAVVLAMQPTPSATKYADDPGILYSPYNWAVSNAAGKTINAGAYFKTIFTGASCTLNFDISSTSVPLPRLLIRVDGRTWQSVPLAASIAVTLPSDQSNTTHLLDVLVDSVTGTVNRWTPQNTAVVLTSIVLASASETITLPKRKGKNLLVYGDSITEGIRSLRQGGATDVDNNASVASWAYALGEQMGAEVGIVGFGSTGWLIGGLGGVPKLSQSYNLMWSGQARDFATYPPDWVVSNMGINDNLNNIVADAVVTINGLLAATPASTRIALVRPFANASQEANLKTAQATCNNPARVFYVSSQGWWNTADASDGIHPYGWAGVSKIAPRLASSLQDIDGIPTADVGLTLTGQLVILN